MDLKVLKKTWLRKTHQTPDSAHLYKRRRQGDGAEKEWFQEFTFSFFFFFRAAPVAYGSFQARGWIGATTASLTTAAATPDPSFIWDPYHSSQQRWILNPLSEARVRTHNLMDPSWVRWPLSHEGNSQELNFMMFVFFCLSFRTAPVACGSSQLGVESQL